MTRSWLVRADHPLHLAPASVDDYRELARRRVPRQLFDYVDGGSFAESTMAANVTDLSRVTLRQRVLRDVAQRRVSTTVLGEEMSLPLVLAPVGFAGMFARRGEVLAARAAARAGVSFCESTLSICSIEEVAAASDRPPWFQLYVMRDRGYAEELMARARAARCRTLVLTVDLAVVGHRYRDVRNGLAGGVSRGGAWRRRVDLVSHPRWVRDVARAGRPLTFGNLARAVPQGRVPQDFQQWVNGQFDPAVTWDDLAWVREHWEGPIVLKGILDPEDARIAVAHGVEGIVVSNHGGRQLDGAPSSITALPGVVEAVDGRAEVLMDGGVRSGLDVVRALARGARACLIGRPWVYAMAARGEAGVDHLLASFRAEMRVAMGLIGVDDVAQIDWTALVDEPER